jgi:hypothetical protein
VADPPDRIDRPPEELFVKRTVTSRNASPQTPDRSKSQLAFLAWPGLLAAVAALQAVAPLVPSESVRQGGGVELALGWLAVTTAGLAWLWSARRPVRWSVPDWLVLLLLGLVLLSAQVMASQGNPRATWNTAWQWVSLLAGFLLMRQLLHPSGVARALVAVVVSIAVALSAHGIYQFAIGLPAQRQQYYGAEESERQRILRDNAVDPAPDSPQRRQFENRLDSSEPFATFGLANSLAGVLVPWTLVLLAIGMAPGARAGWDRRRRVVWCLAMVALLLCLLLTKSRSAWLALLLGGTGFLAARAWYHRAQLGLWGWAAGLAVGLAIAVGLLSGALDREILTEAGLSLRYRLEYWRGAAAMAWDHPWLGCGPGNFQEYYTRYKAPQASETVADPHNLFAETAATIGWIGAAALFSFLALTSLQLWRPRHEHARVVGQPPPGAGNPQGARRRVRGRAGAPQPPSRPVEHPAPGSPHAPLPASPLGAIYGGAILGVVASVPLALLIGFPPEMFIGTPLPISWVVGLPVVAIMLWTLHPWVQHGELAPPVLGLALASLILHLLAAGGIGFPGVAQSLWMLAAVGLNAASPRASSLPAGADTPSADQGTDSRSAAWSWGVAALLSCGLTFAMYLQTYRPVTQARALFLQAPESRSYQQLQGWYAQAAVADPLDPVPWQLLAELSQLRWLEIHDPGYRERFEEAAEQAQIRNSQSASLASYLGKLYLRGYRSAGSHSDLENAVEAFRRAVTLYPNDNMGHAQLAWTAHLAEQTTEARRHAELALQLDARNPHWEQQLGQRSVHDPGPGEGITGQPPPPPPEQSAEQVMQRLRSGEGTQHQSAPDGL